jgi:hypothetical protein
VWVNSNSIFVKTGSPTGGTIYGYAAADPNSNVVKDSSGAILAATNGPAIYVINRGYKDITVGPTVNLYYNDPVNGTSGW